MSQLLPDGCRGVVLYFMGSDLDPTAVQAAIGLTPDHQRVPPREHSPANIPAVEGYSGGVWALTTWGKVDSADITSHVGYALSLLETHSAALKAFRVTSRTMIVFPVPGPGPEAVAPDCRRQAAELGVELVTFWPDGRPRTVR